MKIDGPKRALLRKAILDNFSHKQFDQLLQDRLDLPLANIASANDEFIIQLGNALKNLNFESLIPNLMLALMAERASEDIFRQLAYEWGIHPGLYDQAPSKELPISSLERMLSEDPLLDVQVFLRNLAEASRCVCRVRAVTTGRKACYGTGFLVGEDLLLTNYHILEAIILDPSLGAEVVCKFDYEVNDVGNDINPGVDYGLDRKTPVLASSPPCDYDKFGTPVVDVAWPVACLDYALVRLAEKAGTLPFGIHAEQSTSPKLTARGWIRRIARQPKLDGGANIIIIQHPDKKPMKVAIGLGEIMGSDSQRQRVRYSLNTMEGSSGSPCFDDNFDWIALHNMGDPNYYPAYNQGIVALRIMEDLAKKGYPLF